jgi:predicted Fe-S protein YdhL (DUF1289 family)
MGARSPVHVIKSHILLHEITVLFKKNIASLTIRWYFTDHVFVASAPRYKDLGRNADITPGILTSALDGGEWSASCSGCFKPREESWFSMSRIQRDMLNLQTALSSPHYAFYTHLRPSEFICDVCWGCSRNSTYIVVVITWMNVTFTPTCDMYIGKFA